MINRDPLSASAHRRPDLASAAVESTLPGDVLTAVRRPIRDILRTVGEASVDSASALTQIEQTLKLIESLHTTSKALAGAFRYLHCKFYTHHHKQPLCHNHDGNEPYPPNTGVMLFITKGVDLLEQIQLAIPTYAQGTLGSVRSACEHILARKELNLFREMANLRAQLKSKVNLYLFVDDPVAFQEQEIYSQLGRKRFDRGNAYAAKVLLIQHPAELISAREEFHLLSQFYGGIWKRDSQGQPQEPFLRQFLKHLEHTIGPKLEENLRHARTIIEGTARFIEPSTTGGRIDLKQFISARNEKTLEPITISVESGHPLFLISEPNSGSTTLLDAIEEAATLQRGGFPLRCQADSVIDSFNRIFRLRPPIDQRRGEHGFLLTTIRELQNVITQAKPGDLILVDKLPSGTDNADLNALAATLWKDLAATGATVVIVSDLPKAAEIVAAEFGGVVAQLKRQTCSSDSQRYERLVTPGPWRGSAAMKMLPEVATYDFVKAAELAYQNLRTQYDSVAADDTVTESPEQIETRRQANYLLHERAWMHVDDLLARNTFALALAQLPPECFALNKTRLAIASSLSGFKFDPLDLPRLATGIGFLYGTEPAGFDKRMPELRYSEENESDANDAVCEGRIRELDQNWSANERKAIAKNIDSWEPGRLDQVSQALRIILQIINLSDDHLASPEFGDALKIVRDALVDLDLHDDSIEYRDGAKSILALYQRQFTSEIEDPEIDYLEIDNPMQNTLVIDRLKDAVEFLDTHIGLALSYLKLGAVEPVLTNTPGILRVRNLRPTIVIDDTQAFSVNPGIVPCVLNPTPCNFELADGERGLVLTGPNSTGKSALLAALRLELIKARNCYRCLGEITTTRFDYLFAFFGAGSTDSNSLNRSGQELLAYTMAVHRGNNSNYASLVIIDELPFEDDLGVAAIQQGAIKLMSERSSTLILNTHERRGLKDCAEQNNLALWQTDYQIASDSGNLIPQYTISRDKNFESKSLGIDAAAALLSPAQIARARALRDFFALS